MVEDVGVEAHGEARQQPALDQSGAHRRQEHPEHPQGEEVQQAAVPAGDRLVDDEAGADGDQHLQRGRGQGQHGGAGERPAVRSHEREQPAPGRPALRRFFERGGGGDQAGVAGPAVQPLGAGDPSRPGHGVAHPHESLVRVVEDDPVVALPVTDRRQRHRVEPRRRRLHRAGRQSEALGADDQAPQAGAVERGADHVAHEREGNGATEVPADRSQAGGAAVHLVDRPDRRETTDAAGGTTEFLLGRGVVRYRARSTSVGRDRASGPVGPSPGAALRRPGAFGPDRRSEDRRRWEGCGRRRR